MLGAIAGDIIGSVYEFHNHFSKDFPLFNGGNSFTDDTVCTIAIMDCILNGNDDYDVYLRKHGNRFIHAGFGGMFIKWLMDDTIKAYDSWGNGGAMRVSPVAYIDDDIDVVLNIAKDTCMVSHSHPEGIKGAQALVLAMYHAMSGNTPVEIRKIIETDIGYDLSASYTDLVETYGEFDVSAAGSVPQALICALESTSYEDAIRNAVSIGGDSDTIACMAGALAEILHGMPDDIKVMALKHLPPDYIDIVEQFNARFVD